MLAVVRVEWVYSYARFRIYIYYIIGSAQAPHAARTRLDISAIGFKMVFRSTPCAVLVLLALIVLPGQG